MVPFLSRTLRGYLMSSNLFVFGIAAVATFVYGFLRKKMSVRKEGQFLFRFCGYFLHHSLVGILFMILPIFHFSDILFYVGLGIVIGHGFEEVYFGKKDIKTFFTVISK